MLTTKLEIISALIVSSLFCLQHTDGRTVLLPKGMPTKQSSQFSVAQTADLAYNGNRDGHLVDYSQCTCTAAGDAAPWWLLDLQLVYQIASVSAYNRLDASDEVRFTQIGLGISTDQSVWTSFATGLFYRCAYWTGVPADADNPIVLICPTPVTGRYVTLYKNRTGLADANQAYFNFCEVDVFAAVPEKQLVATKTQPSVSSSSSTSLLASLTAIRSDIECINECSQQPTCLFALFRGSTHQCWLFNSPIISSSFTSVLGSGNKDVNFVALYVF